MSRNVAAEVTAAILAQLENGVVPWVKPWKAGNSIPHNAASRRPYSGSNIVTLWVQSAIAGYSSNGWLTYKQAAELGGNVRKGEKSTTIIYMGRVTKEATATEEAKSFSILKGFAVFNVEQCENLPDHIVSPTVERTVSRNEMVEEFIANTGAVIKIGGDRACYIPSIDRIDMPVIDSFITEDHYYATLFHELAHWTGHRSRLDRSFDKFGSEAYAMEELVAELSAAFVCAEFGIQGDLRHAGYIASWIKLLKANPNAFVQAASKASKAVEHLRQIVVEQAIAA